MIYPKRAIDEIKSRISLVDLIGSDTELFKSGALYKGRCPFTDRHKGSDSDPSFVVYPAGVKGSYDNFYCYGCHVGNKDASGYGSDVFEYLRLRDGLSLKEAIEKAAEISNYPLKPSVVSKNSKAYNRLLTESRRYYKELMKSAKGLSYLKSRGISKESIGFWRLGITPDNYIPEKLSDRITFPILDEYGRTCGFGYRAINSGTPKYINSSESDVFKKKHLWYGLYQNKRNIATSREVIIVEGYMDVILLWQAGIKNAVSSMGTAINDLDVLLKYADSFIIWTDNDEAGNQARERYAKDLVEKNIDFKIVDVGSAGQDPGEIAKSCIDNEKSLQSKIEKHLKHWIQYKTDCILSEMTYKQIEAKIEACNNIVEVFAQFPREENLDIFIKYFADTLGITTEYLRARIEERKEAT